jgi:hypothetical protein
MHLQFLVRHHDGIVAARIRKVVCSTRPWRSCETTRLTSRSLSSSTLTSASPPGVVTPVIRKQRPAPAINPDGGRLDLTADFPIAPATAAFSPSAS